MIKKLTIRNYRVFKETEFPRLAGVNLFVGKNNSGKSGLLEALRIFNDMTPETIKSIITARDENWDDIPLENIDIARKKSESPVRSLFYSYETKNNIYIGFEKERTLLEDERNFVEIKVVKEQSVEFLSASGARFSCREGRLTFSTISKAISKESPPTQYVHASRCDMEMISSLWDYISLTDDEESVVDGLRLVEPMIKRVAFIGPFLKGNNVTSRRIPVVRLEKSQDIYPLNSMGGGISRIFYMILALVNSRGGMLLIDEFENGLHWKTQEKLWRIIFSLAVKLNVQVFATTHSMDCVKSFHSIWSQNEAKGTFYRLDRNCDKGVTGTSYDVESLGDSLMTDVEMR